MFLFTSIFKTIEFIYLLQDTFTRAAPLTDGIGKLLMEKMGWKAGSGLGKNNEGIKVPIPVEIKTDRKGIDTGYVLPLYVVINRFPDC